MLFYIVDDEESIHESLKRVLLKKYPEVGLADFYNLEDLVDELRRNRKRPDSVDADLIFLDNMFDKESFSSGGITGIDTLPRIRKQAPAVPVILFTAIDNYEEVQRIQQFSEVRYQHKPIDETQLYMMVEDILREHGQIQEYDRIILDYEKMIKDNEARIEQLRKTLENISNDDEKAEKMYPLMEDMQEQAIATGKEDFSSRLSDLRRQFRNVFAAFDEKATKFLATGEFFYDLVTKENIEDKNIDCSPIAIDYVKCVEYLTRKLLQKKGFIDQSKDKLMLGEAMDLIFVSKQSWKANFYEQLDRVREYRNRTAHQTGFGRNAVHNLRRLLFDSSQVENGEGLLAYLNAELARL